jgi:transcriptional regulator with XRE-family HTH domain
MVHCHNTVELIAEIKKYMFLKHIQQKELSVAIGKKHQTVSSMLKDTSNPTMNSVFEICDYLGIELILKYKDESSDNSVVGTKETEKDVTN